MIRRIARLVACSIVLAVLARPAEAGPVVAGPTINGLATFTDQATGWHWVRLDSYFDVSYNFMAADVTSKGFVVASQDEVGTLVGTLPLGSGEWSGYAAIMGSAPNRDLIWGATLPTVPGNLAWAYAFDGDPGWSFDPTTGYSLDFVPNGGSDAADMNIWAYTQTNVVGVPEPSTVGLGLMGLAALAAWTRRNRK